VKRLLAPWLLAAVLAPALAQAPVLAPADFTWRATLEPPAQSALARVTLPAQAMLRLQSRDAADLRVFDAQGQPVPFAFSRPPNAKEPPRQPTRNYAALPLYSANADARAPKGSVQVRVQEGGQQRSLWVHMSPGGTSTSAPASSRRLPSALFDTRSEKEAITALVVRGQLPANAPVRVTLSTSPDLANWTPVAARGRLYRFDGDGAPANDTLELSQPLRLEKQYLKLEWDGQQGVQVDSIAGLIAPKVPKPEPTMAPLPAGRPEGASALEWELGFATPLSALALTLEKPNSLVPVRISGRNQLSEPWRTLGHAVVWRLGSGADETRSDPAVLQQPSVRWLRVEATHGMRLEGLGLQAQAVFEPLQLVFVAGGAAPYSLAAGRAATPSVALPLGMLSAASTRQVDEWPQAKLSAVQDQPPAPSALAAWLPRGVDTKTATLWAVLGFGVIVLGAVAWSLLRAMKGPVPPAG
jgi:hypothetical protein